MAESLFTSQTPAGTNNSDGAPGIGTATTVMFAVAGQVTGIRFFATTTVSGTYTAALYQVTGDDGSSVGTGTLLASKVGGTPTGGTWNTITFDTPVSVDTTHGYRAVIHSSAGRYVNTSGFFTSSALVNGNITGVRNGVDFGLGSVYNGTFEVNAALTYPTDSFGESCYFVDVVFTAGGGGGSSVAPGGVAVAVALGAPALAWSASVAPGGLSVPVAVGAPVAGAAGVNPDGAAVPVVLGNPALSWSGTVAPDGVSASVALGSPGVGAAGLAPDGIAVPVALGAPVVVWAAVVAPGGVVVPVAVGGPSAVMPGQRVTRPNTGVVARPSSGLVVRPNSGVVVRP